MARIVGGRFPSSIQPTSPPSAADGAAEYCAAAAAKSLIDLAAATVVRQRDLPEVPRDFYPVEVSPDGRLVAFGLEDEILVLDNGTIVERGNHQELLRRKGIYYNLYLLQYRNG